MVLRIWQDAARPSPRGAALPIMITHVRAGWPLTRLLVRGFEHDGRLISTQADSADEDAGIEPLSCSDDLFERLQRWAQRGRVQSSTELIAQEPQVLRALPAPRANEYLVGGLVGTHGALGLLIAAAADEIRKSTRLNSSHPRLSRMPSSA